VQEARSASALNHPGIVTIHDIDEHEGTTFIAMELVEGRALDQPLAQGPLGLEQALDHAVQMPPDSRPRTPPAPSIAISSRPTS
jgi:serine/threonine protein kinase